MTEQVETSLNGLQLWAASKFLGRECADVSLAYLECKEANGKHPKECISHSKQVVACFDGV